MDGVVDDNGAITENYVRFNEEQNMENGANRANSVAIRRSIIS